MWSACPCDKVDGAKLKRFICKQFLTIGINGMAEAAESLGIVPGNNETYKSFVTKNLKVIFDAKYGEWLGNHAIGYNVTEIIAQTVTARKLETT